jgi:hypothetical protein
MLEGKINGPVCPSCNKTQIKLVSVSDNGKGPKICQKCKKLMKNSVPIEKFDRASVNLQELENELKKKAKEVLEASR